MFSSFVLSRRWLPWADPGGVLILLATLYKVELDVRINEWFGDFYNLIRKALGGADKITLPEYMGHLATFGVIAGIAVAVFTDFFVKHYVFRWRTTDFYAAHWTRSATSREPTGRGRLPQPSARNLSTAKTTRRAPPQRYSPRCSAMSAATTSGSSST